MTTKRWFFYTVIVGALPLIIRCFMLLFLKDSNWRMFINPIDFVFLGLTLNLTNINVLNSMTNTETSFLSFRENSIWWSTLAIIFLALNLSVLYIDSFMSEKILNGFTLKLASILLCIGSLAYSYRIIYKLNQKEN